MSLSDKILKLKRRISGISSNPILNAIEIEECKIIDSISDSDDFVKKRRKSIIDLMEGLDIDFKEKYKSIYDNYSEIMVYLNIKDRFEIFQIPEGKEKTPDFKILFENQELFIELKSLSFADGNLNYKKVQKDSLNANIEIEDRLKKGDRIAFGVYEIDPLRKGNKELSYGSIIEDIELLISKIDQNVKPDQYSKGSTILMIDMKQIDFMSGVKILKENAVPFYKYGNSIISGLYWNIAFGKVGNLILKQIEFEGKGSIDGTLKRDGILNKYNIIKGLVIIGYDKLKERKMIGFIRSDESDQCLIKFMNNLCFFINDETNFNGFDVVSQSN